MNVASCLKLFENSFSSYTGDDPLEEWLKFVEYLDQRLPASGSSEMSVVLDKLVQNFLGVERYADDARFVDLCIRYTTYYLEPTALFGHLLSKGVGTRTAALYLAWAQRFEHQAMLEQADAVYRKALENQARPAESLLQEYRQFRARCGSQERLPGGVAEPSSDSGPAAPAQAAAELQASGGAFDVCTGQRSFKSMYCKDALAPEGSELCFEEVRAQTYLHKARLKREAEELLRQERLLREDEEAVARLRQQLRRMEALKMSASGRPTSQEGCSGPQAQENLNASQGNGLKASHVTPNTSLSCPDATPSHVAPSPTINTREALDTIMGMFQAPTLTEEPLGDTLAVVTGGKLSADANGAAPLGNFAAAMPFSIYRDDVSATASRTLSKSKPTRGRGLSEIPPPAEANVAAGGWSRQDKTAEEMSEGWLAACPNNTADFALAARCVSTPFAHKGAGGQATADVTSAGREAEENTFIRHLHKLSPILEQSPPDEKSSASQPPSSFAGTIVGEGLAGHQPDASSATLVRAPPPQTALSFGDGTTLGPSAAVRQFSVADHLPREVGKTASDSIASIWAPVSPAPADQHVASPEKECHHLCDARPLSDSCGGHLVSDLLSATTPMPPAGQRVAGGAKVEENLHASQGSALDASHVGPDTPSAVPPSPTVNTREALDVIMGMFQAPALTEEPLGNTSSTFITSGKPSVARANGAAPLGNFAAAVPFSIYRDDVSATASRTLSKSKPTRGRGLSEISPPAEANVAAAGWSRQDKTAEEMSEGWLAACPNNTADFALAARCVSTPFAHKGAGGQATEDVTRAGGEADRDPFIKHSNKLSLIMEQSPPEQTPCASGIGQPATSSVARGGTIMSREVGAHSAQAPMPPLSGDCTELGPPAAMQPFGIFTDLQRHSPQEVGKNTSGAMAPMSPPPADQHMASPEKERGGLAQLLSDPWSGELLSDLLSSMSPPLTSHPQCVRWQRRLPDIGAKKTIGMGKASLRVDRILGRGAFATVYQATDRATSHKMALKVQKPANLWEFYINTQLDRRLPVSVRHLFSRVPSAHVFTDGSVLLGELHAYGTLLNAANLYKSIGEKVMPQPLVIYFTVCILRMLEELHAARIVHADIKPDNFMLGQRFVERADFAAEHLEHGLVLVDMGQSIDMDLFPPGTAFTARCLTSGFQCTEMLSGKPWNYQTDLFGAAGTVHVLLFGTYMQVVQDGGEWRTRATFRRNPHSDMWLHLFRTLLNVPACRPALAALADLRRRLSAVLQRDYRHKMASLKSRLLVLLLESRKDSSQRQ